MPQFVGELEIESVVPELGTDRCTVSFTEASAHPPVTMNTSLLGDITTEEKGDGNITDCVNHHFAKSVLSQMALKGLKMYNVEGVSMAMRTLAHNLREIEIGKRFGCSGGDDMTLASLIPDEDVDDVPEMKKVNPLEGVVSDTEGFGTVHSDDPESAPSVMDSLSGTP